MRGRGPSFEHLARLTDERGVFEHATGVIPRRNHGYCVDDAARALIVTTREKEQTPQLASLTETYLRFVAAAVRADGYAHNRMNTLGQWTDQPGLGDWWGRAIWGLGIASVKAPLPQSRHRALHAFHVAAEQRSGELRPMVFAALGAGEVLLAHPSDTVARELLLAAVQRIDHRTSALWPWPEPRLRYGNASIPEALILAGHALNDAELMTRGIDLLSLLVEIEMRDGHLSVTGTKGRWPADREAQFDQQPIEVAAMAEAATRAFAASGDQRWLDLVRLSGDWFYGNNDVGVAMVNPVDGAGYDGLHRQARNENCGAESTIAAISTAQLALRASRMVSLV